MPLNIQDFPADPECVGSQWFVLNQDELATLVGTVLIGRAEHAARVLAGTQQHVPVQTSAALKAKLRRQLLPPNGPLTYHRDGLLFEIICWFVAKKKTGPNEIISDPHLSSTQQGVDTLKLTFDPITRSVTKAVVCEQKCTENPRAKFRDEVLPAFREWMIGTRDNQLTQISTGLLSRFALTDAEYQSAFDTLVQERPLRFQASLTVAPNPFEKDKCVAVFKDFTSITDPIENRMGDTFPLLQIRNWFSGFANLVWQRIEASDV